MHQPPKRRLVAQPGSPWLRRARLALLPLAAVAGVSGCSLFDHHHPKDAGTNLQPAVTLRNGEIDIQPLVLRFRKSDGPVTITWRLTPRDGLKLPDQAVVLEDPRRSKLSVDPELRQACPQGYDSPEGVFSCGPGARPNEYVCKNANAKPGCYKYTFRLLDGSRLIERDPPIINFMD